jgi:hypothetical protein
MVSVALRLRLRLIKGGRSVEVIALVNSGYETREPEILVPASIATQLSLSGDEPGALVKEYKLADGSTTRLLRIPRAVLVYAVEEDRVVGPVEASLVVAEKADEALISDKLAGKLGVVILDLGEGVWCFKDEVGRVFRKTW